MALRCFLYSSDEGTSDVIRPVITALGVEGESCAEASTAAQRIANESYQLVIVDWDQQPEASMLLSTARERKASERPLTLAIVSDDASVPTALQAGANSILRKPLLLNQVTDTLTTARDLLQSRQQPAAVQSAATSATSPSGLPPNSEAAKEKTLRAGEFLQAAPVTPGGQFETDADMPTAAAQAVPQEVDPLKDLEPMAAAVPEKVPVPLAPAAESDEPRGLEWHLKARGVVRSSGGGAPPPPPLQESKPELLGYQSHSSSAPAEPEAAIPQQPEPSAHERKREAELFAYIDGDDAGTGRRSGFRLGKGAIAVALLLAGGAITAAPQAPWHAKILTFWSRGQRALHTWLNPQPVTVAVAPPAHEDFGRPGDEYKLPVAENIPDATTDPSQVQVVPIVDPTAKKPTPDPAASDPGAIPADPAPVAPTNTAETPTTKTPETQPVQGTPDVSPQAVGPSSSTAPPSVATPVPAQSHAEVATATPPPTTAPTTSVRRQPTEYTPIPTKVPSSLQSQMVSMTPEASGNKPVEAALPAIEPVDVPELTERNLLLEQPPIGYPATARGQHGTVILHVLIGRDGVVQDAKFLQGSLAFARTAIEGVKQWKFKPYTMNGRPVSVETLLTLKF